VDARSKVYLADTFFIEQKRALVLTNRRFQLNRDIVGIQLVDGSGSIVTVPGGAVISVLSGPNGQGSVPERGIVYVLWEGRTVALFAVDVQARGTDITDKSTRASGAF
jgi:hypothetical protein